MNEIFWYDGKNPCHSVWTSDVDAAYTLADALQKIGKKVVWMQHTLDTVRPKTGFEKAYEQWKKDVDNS